MSKSYFVEEFRRTNLRGFHYFAYRSCFNYHISQSSIIVCFNHVAHKHFCKKSLGYFIKGAPFPECPCISKVGTHALKEMP